MDLRHTVGGVDSFDRRKFITLHASNLENDWTLGTNEDPDLMESFLVGLDVYFGRDTGNLTYSATQLPQDPNRAGFIDEAAAENNGGSARWNYTMGTEAKWTLGRAYADRATDMVVGAQQHPFWPDGTEVGQQGWSFSQTDTADEPFGTAVGHYMANFLYWYFNRGENDVESPGNPWGSAKPLYLEVMNEPLFELVDYPSGTPTTPEKVFEFHNNVANEVRAFRDQWGLASHDNVKIGGYTVAFPDFERNDFNHWETRDKLFIDIAGTNMDFISMHLYDFPVFNGKYQLRRGSNVEATFDMIEQYMHMTLGEVKPFVISEFGASTHALFNDPWTPYRDGLKLKALNGLMMSLIERPDQIAKAIPFIPVKAEWGRTSVPYNDRLMRQKNEAVGGAGEEWVYTDLVKFYELWSDVKGTRVDTWADDPDFQVDAYVDGETLHLIINSLEMADTTIDLALLGANGNTVTQVNTKHLYYDADGNPVLDTNTTAQLPTALEVKDQATIIVSVRFEQALSQTRASEEAKYYASSYKQAISSNSTISQSIDGVTLGTAGEAVLRLGIGRAHGKSLLPIVTMNGETLTVPTDFRGYDQYHNGQGRDSFYGVIEIPVPYSALRENNAVEVSFPDDGGWLASTALQVFSMPSSPNRGQR